MVSDAHGNIHFTRAGLGGRAESLELGRNILSASSNFSVKERYSEITVYAQQQLNPFISAEQVALQQARVTDADLAGRYRPLAITLSTPGTSADCEQAAAWERATRYARGSRVVYRVNGWAQKGGALWPVNGLVNVRDHWKKIDGDRLIEGVQMTSNKQGRFAEISVVPVEAYSLQAKPEPKAANDAAF